MLQGKHLYHSIGGSEILRDLSIAVEPAKVSCLIGPSGSGKSTVLNCLSWLTRPTRGVISVDGQEYIVNNGSGSANGFPYPLVTVVFQGLFLWPHLTNEANILLPLNGSTLDSPEVQDIVAKLDIQHVLKKYPNESSGGERQRVALARQILLKPKYLLLDEITSALDLETVNSVADILLSLKRSGVGILLVTHMINLAKLISDDFYFLDKGVLVEAGDISGLENPQTKRLNKFLQIYS